MGLGTQLMWPVGLFLAYFVLQSKTKLEFNCWQSKVIHITESEYLTLLWTITDSLPFSKAGAGLLYFQIGSILTDSDSSLLNNWA